VLLLLFWWFYVIAALAVKIKLGSPVLFKQDRLGKDEKIFTIYKFRSMLPTSLFEDKLIHPEKRLTRFGIYLRSTSLDELPQVWNVLKGEMSFIGPRPLPIRYLPRYSQEQKRRLLVKPGITGWAQVNGRNLISWSEKFKMDVEYVDHYSFMMDTKIFFLTIKNVFFRDGITPENKLIGDEFMGDDDENIRQ